MGADAADATDDDDGQPGDKMYKRIGESRSKIWLLLDADRRLVAGIGLALVFVAFLVAGVADPAPLRQAMATNDPIETLFEEYVAAVITGVTLVLTLNQLILSQELGAVGDQRERMEGAMEFREDVEDAIDAPISPPEPAAFLRAIIDVTQTRAEELREAVADCEDDQLERRTEEYVDSLVDNAEAVGERLEGEQFGSFAVLFAALDFNYSWKIYEARRLRNEYADSLTDETEAAFDAIGEALEFFGPAREHFKTLYFQWELADLSRLMLYSAVPAVLVTSLMVIYVDNPGTITGDLLGVDNLVWTVSAAAVVALLPFMLLLSYILRIVTVAKRTLSIGPFILRETDRTEDINWDE
ncbi:hypothetical protein ACFQE1_09795 [Halobium palmae]|uniref:Uncharacterized protein n=1 Tax=Halobium palmae TaxID=1776492 RepID=A0ABD5RZ23_9EURY